MIKVDKILCPQNHKCPMIMRCPKKAISQKGFGLPTVDSKKCMLCGFCIENCPFGAFKEC